jgi:hypothetical protein
MKKAKSFMLILMFSAFISILGFIFDMDERYPDIMVNIKDVLLMTALIFSAVSILYLIYLLFAGLVAKKQH